MRFALLPVHIAAGSIAIVAGFVALHALKGAKLHRKSGTIFVYAMLLMSSSAAVAATALGEELNAAQGALTFYLVTTALLTVRPRDRLSRRVDAGAMYSDCVPAR